MATILVVDDSEDALDLFEGFLGQEHEVRLAHDWVEANGAFRDDVDLVILDVNMPTLRGNQLAGILLKAKADLRVVLASAMDEVDLRRLAQESGAAGYLTKQFDESLLPRVNALLRTRPGQRPSSDTLAR